MNVTGIIAEYNPFHNGHAYQIQQIKEQLHSDFCIVVMSGDFVQRGECAIVDKYLRAKMALLSGADLVLELPVLFSTASAPYFAFGGCKILDALGCVDNLCFGTESGTAEEFETIASLLIKEPDGFKTLLEKHLKTGMSFPLARSKALSELFPEAESLISSPNSILGLEYTKALLSMKSKIQIYPLLRNGMGYHSNELTSLSSATAIRNHLQKGNLREIQANQAMPESSLELLQNQICLTTDTLSSILGMKLLELTSAEELEQIFDIGPFLANRIWQKRFDFRNIDQFADLLKTKNETLLHIKRSLLHIILSIMEPSKEELIPSYTRILGMKKDASPLLRMIKDSGTIPVITKLSGSDSFLSSYYEAQPDIAAIAKQQLAQTTFASNLYQMELARMTSQIFRHENTRQFPVL